MFFIGIFGTSFKEKIIKILNSIPCKSCNWNTSGKPIKKYSYFHFFFIPIFKYGIEYYVVCNRCNSIYRISKEKGLALERGEITELKAYDLEYLGKENNYNSNNYERNNGFNSEFNLKSKCPKCGALVDEKFTYCPECGEKLK